MNRNEALEKINQIKKIAAQGDFKEALNALEELIEETNDDVLNEVSSCEVQLQEDARNAISVARSELDQLLDVADADSDKIQKIDIYHINDLISRLERADINNTYVDNIGTYKEHRNDIQARQVELQGIKKFIDKIKKIRSEIKELENQNVAPSIRLDKYREATKVAREAYAKYPHSIQVLAYKDECEREENRYAVAAQIYTSALDTERYQQALDELQGLADDVMVPRFIGVKDKNSYEGEVTVAEARREIRRLANDWASKKKQEYTDEARLLLMQNRPLEAKDKLEDTQKIIHFLEISDRNEINELQEEITSKITKLRRAEKKAQDALRQVETNPQIAWKTLNQAREIYAGPSKVDEASETIIASLQAQVKQIKDKAEHAIDRSDFKTLQGCKVQIKRYKTIDEPTIDEACKEITQLCDDGEQLRKDRQTAQAEFSNAKKLSLQNSQSALERLKKLKQTFSDTVLNQVDGFNQLFEELEGKVDLDSALNTLKKRISSLDLGEVSDSITTLQNLEESNPGNQRIKDTLANLELTKQFLTARNERSNGNLSKAEEFLQSLLHSNTHPRFSDAKIMQSEIENIKGQQSQFEITLNKAQQQVTSNPQKVISILERLIVEDSALNREKNRILQSAKDEYTRAISNELFSFYEQWQQIQHGITSDNLDNALLVKIPNLVATLQDLGSVQEYQLWNERLNLFIRLSAAKKYSQSTDTNILNRAITSWEEVIELAEETVSAQIETYRKEYLEVHHKRIERRLLTTRNTQDTTQKSVSLKTLLEDIDIITERFPSDYMLAYYRAEITGSLAAISLRDNARHSYYGQMLGDANRASNLIAQNDLQPNAQIINKVNQLQNEAQTINTVLPQMDQIDRAMGKRTVNDMVEAHTTWINQIESKIEDESSLHLWWNTLRTEKLAELKDLVPPITGARDINIEHINIYAMILVLEPEDPTAVAMVRHIPDIINRLEILVKAACAELRTASNTHTFDDKDDTKIGVQITNLEVLKTQLDAIRETIFYVSDKVPITTQQALEGSRMKLAETINEIARAIQDATQFRDRLMAFRKQIEDNSRSPVKELPNSLEDSNIVDEKYQQSNYSQQDMIEFKDHPDYKEISSTLKVGKDTFRALVLSIIEISRLIEKGKYREAKEMLDTISRQDLNRYGFQDTVIARITAERYTGNDLEALQKALDHNAEEMTKIYEFANPFEADAVTGRPSTDKVIPWEAAKQIIEDFVKRGRFDDARKTLNDALGSTTENTSQLERTQSGNVTLSAAYWRIQYPPVINAHPANIDGYIPNTDTIDSRYQNATHNATETQTRILDYLKDSRWSVYRDHYEDAKETIDFIDEQEKTWQSIWDEWQREIEFIAGAFAQCGGVHKKSKLKGNDRSTIMSAASRTNDILEECRKSFGKHPRLNDMESLELLRHAGEVARGEI